ncbi:hypothetical protein AVDCRST_MAG84-3707 [uncultured Microcoleus sp.]|uniref:Uncharacterized protein n=1 Tax=uncultured Microcoleus sp. TaxID=259945 RepID=A0A6J4MNF2_9CYAN|nr:hypothetical protein AVDCRST_MAG84-3707 [uncultured Microcoleus sp.]
MPGLDRLSVLATGSKMNSHTIVRILKNVNIISGVCRNFKLD